MSYIVVVDREGQEHRLDALNGWRIMEIIRDHELPIKGECGGCCSCATCHVYVDEAWRDRIPKREDEEDEMLDEAFSVEDNSRLSCQILFSEDLEGLRVYLAPEGA